MARHFSFSINAFVEMPTIEMREKLTNKSPDNTKHVYMNRSKHSSGNLN